MAKFTKRHKGVYPQGGSCKGKLFSLAESRLYLFTHFFGTHCEDTDRDVFCASLGRDVSAREFDIARSIGLVE